MTDAERIKEMPPEHRAIVAGNLRRMERESGFGLNYDWMADGFA